jgi:WD40 repeat protein
VAESAMPDVRLWDREGRLIAKLSTTPYEDALVVFERNSRYFCIVDKNIVKLWDRNGSPLPSLTTARETYVKYVSFSPEGGRILIASYDGTVQSWDIEGRLVTTFKGHETEVNSALFSPDGKRVLTASSDGTARQFLVEVDDLIAVSTCRVGRGLDAEEIARFNVPTPLRFNPTQGRATAH